MAASETATSKRPDHEKAPPTGYTLVLPPGWSRIPLRHGTEQAITKILDRAFAGLPRDQVASLRRGLQLRLRDLAERAREGSGLDLYLPTERMGEVTATASFVVAEMSLVSAEPVDPSMLVARLVADSEHTAVVEVAGSAGTRTEHVAAAEPEQGSSMRPADSTTCCRSRRRRTGGWSSRSARWAPVIPLTSSRSCWSSSSTRS